MDRLLEIQRKGTTILLVTHDPKVAAKSERVHFMLDGRSNTRKIKKNFFSGFIVVD